MRKAMFGVALGALMALSVVALEALGNGALAAVVSVTESQVRNVCGKDLQSNGGAIGCRKGTTDYNCHQGKCQAISFRKSGPDTAMGTMTGNAPAGSQTRSGSKRTTDPVRAVSGAGTYQQRKN